jgi:hypothetical protein
MDDLLARTCDHLVGRTVGPLRFRLIVQPLVAASMAAGSGLRDAVQNRPPFLSNLCGDPKQRTILLRAAWKEIRRLCVVAFVGDAVYQVLVFRWVYPAQALVVVALLAIVPYVALRGLVTRLARGVKLR